MKTLYGRQLARSLGTVLLTAALWTPVTAEDVVVNIDDIDLGELRSATFEVTERTRVRISAVGAERKHGESMFAYPWIIDVESREMVWSMDEEFTEPTEDTDWLRKFDDDIAMAPGVYELHYYASKPYMLYGDYFNFGSWDFDGDKNDNKDKEKLSRDLEDLLDALGHWIKDNKDGMSSDEARKLTRHFGVTLYSDGSAHSVRRGTGVPEPLVSLSNPDNDAYLSQAFALTTDMDIRIYAIGEYYSSDEIMVDWGWIADARTREPVWEMTRHNTDWAGGSSKNRKFEGRKRLPAGEYVAYYVTDDSHCSDDWNAPPPFDPSGYGLQLLASSDDQRSQVRLIEDSYEADPIVRLTRIGDNELVSEAFHASSKTKLRVYAIGEYDRFGDVMADYAWIVRSDSPRKKYWVMSGSNTQPAGGDSKNRRFDGIVEFEPGDYIMYYSSDGSHSYGDGWNSSPPFDQKAYGVSIFPADPDAPAPAIRIEHDTGHRPGAIAEIVGVRDDESKKIRFSLETPTRVNILAIGEGTRYGMVDYGWIENARSGDVVWEMTYRKTSHAGGADKNRQVEQAIILDKGEYTLHYVTDDSHATGDWNADPPSNPALWGISLIKSDKSGE